MRTGREGEGRRPTTVPSLTGGAAFPSPAPAAAAAALSVDSTAAGRSNAAIPAPASVSSNGALPPPSLLPPLAPHMRSLLSSEFARRLAWQAEQQRLQQAATTARFGSTTSATARANIIQPLPVASAAATTADESVLLLPSLLRLRAPPGVPLDFRSLACLWALDRSRRGAASIDDLEALVRSTQAMLLQQRQQRRKMQIQGPAQARAIVAATQLKQLYEDMLALDRRREMEAEAAAAGTAIVAASDSAATGPSAAATASSSSTVTTDAPTVSFSHWLLSLLVSSHPTARFKHVRHGAGVVYLHREAVELLYEVIRPLLLRPTNVALLADDDSMEDRMMQQQQHGNLADHSANGDAKLYERDGDLDGTDPARTPAAAVFVHVSISELVLQSGGAASFTPCSAPPAMLAAAASAASPDAVVPVLPSAGEHSPSSGLGVHSFQSFFDLLQRAGEKLGLLELADPVLDHYVPLTVVQTLVKQIERAFKRSMRQVMSSARDRPTTTAEQMDPARVQARRERKQAAAARRIAVRAATMADAHARAISVSGLCGFSPPPPFVTPRAGSTLAATSSSASARTSIPVAAGLVPPLSPASHLLLHPLSTPVLAPSSSRGSIHPMPPPGAISHLRDIVEESNAAAAANVAAGGHTASTPSSPVGPISAADEQAALGSAVFQFGATTEGTTASKGHQIPFLAVDVDEPLLSRPVDSQLLTPTSSSSQRQSSLPVPGSGGGGGVRRHPGVPSLSFGLSSASARSNNPDQPLSGHIGARDPSHMRTSSQPHTALSAASSTVPLHSGASTSTAHRLLAGGGAESGLSSLATSLSPTPLTSPTGAAYAAHLLALNPKRASYSTLPAGHTLLRASFPGSDPSAPIQTQSTARAPGLVPTLSLPLHHLAATGPLTPQPPRHMHHASMASPVASSYTQRLQQQQLQYPSNNLVVAHMQLGHSAASPQRSPSFTSALTTMSSPPPPSLALAYLTHRSQAAAGLTQRTPLHTGRIGIGAMTVAGAAVVAEHTGDAPLPSSHAALLASTSKLPMTARGSSMTGQPLQPFQSPHLVHDLSQFTDRQVAALIKDGADSDDELDLLEEEDHQLLMEQTHRGGADGQEGQDGPDTEAQPMQSRFEANMQEAAAGAGAGATTSAFTIKLPDSVVPSKSATVSVKMTGATTTKTRSLSPSVSSATSATSDATRSPKPRNGAAPSGKLQPKPTTATKPLAGGAPFSAADGTQSSVSGTVPPSSSPSVPTEHLINKKGVTFSTPGMTVPRSSPNGGAAAATNKPRTGKTGAPAMPNSTSAAASSDSTPIASSASSTAPPLSMSASASAPQLLVPLRLSSAEGDPNGPAAAGTPMNVHRAPQPASSSSSSLPSSSSSSSTSSNVHPFGATNSPPSRAPAESFSKQLDRAADKRDSKANAAAAASAAATAASSSKQPARR